MNDSGKWSMDDWWYCSWLLCIYGCVFFPLLSTAFTFMRICVFSADWCYCSWLSCIFVCFLTIDDIALDFYADLPKVQLRQMQGHGPYLSCSTFNTSISKKKGKCILIIKPAVTKLYALIGLSCTVLVALLIRRYTQDERSFASSKHEVPSGAAGTYHILQYLETDLISAGLHLSALIHSQIIYISWALPLSMLTAPHLSFSLLSTQYCPASSYYQLNIF